MSSCPREVEDDLVGEARAGSWRAGGEELADAGDRADVQADRGPGFGLEELGLIGFGADPPAVKSAERPA